MMKDILSIGSVVQLKNGEVKLMIINRFPLFNKEGTIGYFDYSACIFPIGNVDNQVYFFNAEDIDIVWNPKTKKIAFYDMEHKELKDITDFVDFIENTSSYMQKIIEGDL